MLEDPTTRRRFLRHAGMAGAAASVPAWVLDAFPGVADAASFCPHPNPIVNENHCTDPFSFSGDFQLSTPTSIVAGFARQPSVNVGQSIDLSISGPNNYLPPAGTAPLETVQVDVYRLGYYEGYGGRKVWSSAAGISTFQKVDGAGTPSNSGARRPARPDVAATGVFGHADDRTVVTVPGSALGVSGVYLARCKGNWVEYPPGVDPVARSGDSHIVFVVRDDNRTRDVLVLIPTNTYQAYNYSTGRSLYTAGSKRSLSGSIVPATGTERAAKVSLDRPFSNYIADYDWVLRTEYPAIWWLEKHGYDVAYTEDTHLTYHPEQLLPGRSKALMVLGHGEYWTQGMRDGVEAARDAGTSIYNLGANTCYWRVRYETANGAAATGIADARVMVCYKTIEGGASDLHDPDQRAPLAGGDAIASLADPVSPTTTWRDPGKSPAMERPGTWSATPSTYAGPNRPESGLFGVQYVGADSNDNRPFTVPADNGRGEFAGHRAWRYCGIPSGGVEFSRTIVGWEWDGIPGATQPFTARPATKADTPGLQRLSESDPRLNVPNPSVNQYVTDAGRRYSVVGAGAQPPPGGTPFSHATTYTAPSGALVFSSGTIMWSWGLGPHFVHRFKDTYADPPIDSSDQRIAQAMTNLLADGGIYPLTPTGLLFDGPTTAPTQSPAPTAAPAVAAPLTAAPLTAAGAPTPIPPAAAIPTLALALSSGRLSRTGKLTARVIAKTAVPRAISGKLTLTVGRTTIASGSYKLAANGTRSAAVSLKLTTKARKNLVKEGRSRPLAKVTIVDGGRTVRNDFTRLTLRPYKAAKRK
ncbi:MAG: twin-arginine translocation signal domain-containing protein [Patulibacter minatonensis]